MRRHRPDALDLVGRDGHPEPRPADEQRPVAFPRRHQLGRRRRDVRVCRVVVRPDVHYRDHPPVCREVGLDLVLVADAGFLEERGGC